MHAARRILRSGNVVSVDKPKMVLDYAANMGGIFVIVLNNFQDELTSEYNFQILDSLDPQKHQI